MPDEDKNPKFRLEHTPWLDQNFMHTVWYNDEPKGEQINLVDLGWNWKEILMRRARERMDAKK